MIVRILEEGQFHVPDNHLEDLNALDDRVLSAVEAGDEAGFEEALATLLDGVRARGTRVEDDYLGPSDLVLPASGSSLEDVRAVLGDEGLIPG